MNKLVVILTGILSLTGCKPHTVYIQGGERAQATVEIGAIGGKIHLTGPFIYCADSPGKDLSHCSLPAQANP